MISAEYPTGAGRLVFVGFDSEVLAGNRYGDPTFRQHPVYLPPSYDPTDDRRYPVIYGLSGYTGTGMHFFAPGTFTDPLHLRLDRLIAGGMPEVIFVGVDCMTTLGGSQYVNGACGRYEDYLVTEVTAAIESDLKTTAESHGRGLCGKSSGGFGTLALGMRHPNVFNALVCHSGDAGFVHSILRDIPTAVGVLGRYKGNEAERVEAFLRDFMAKEPRTFTQGHTLMWMGCAAAYSPDPSQPHGFSLPFDVHTGEVIPEVWDRWLAWDPVNMVSSHADALRRAKLLMIDCGTRDQYALHLGARQLNQRLSALDVSHIYEEFDDDHSGLQYRYDVSLPRIARALSASASTIQEPA